MAAAADEPNIKLLSLISASGNLSGYQGDSSGALYCTGLSVDACDLPASLCVCVFTFLFSQPAPVDVSSQRGRALNIKLLDIYTFLKHLTYFVTLWCCSTPSRNHPGVDPGLLKWFQGSSCLAALMRLLSASLQTFIWVLSRFLLVLLHPTVHTRSTDTAALCLVIAPPGGVVWNYSSAGNYYYYSFFYDSRSWMLIHTHSALV